MAYKVFIDAGHGGTDPGAVKYVKEADVNLHTAVACRDYLKAHGITTKMTRTKDVNTSLTGFCKECNKWGADLAISIHNNAGGGDGFEIYHSYLGGKGKTLAKNVANEVKKIGQNAHGEELKTKTRVTNGKKEDYYGFIRLINCPSIICEGAFVDNKIDAKIIDTLEEQKKFGYAYAKGILTTLGIKPTGYIALQDLNIREKGNLQAKVLGKIEEGTIISGTLNSEGWLKTSKGYVRVKSDTKTYCKKL